VISKATEQVLKSNELGFLMTAPAEVRFLRPTFGFAC